MSENIQCQDWENCVGLLKLMNQYDKALVETRAEQKLIVEKLDDLTTDVREMKDSLGTDFDRRVDERITAKLNEQKVSLVRWVITSLAGSGVLTVILNWLLNR